MDNTDIKRLYDAFTELCDYIEQETEGGCMECPYNKVCFGMAGNEFAKSLKRIKAATAARILTLTK